MLQKLDKKNYIFFLLIVFLILSSTHNSNFKYNNFFNIKKIEVVGLNKTDNAFLENEFTDLVGSNIFTLNKKSFELINSVNQIKSYNVKKIYPNQVKVYLESAKAIGFVKNINEFVIHQRKTWNTGKRSGDRGVPHSADRFRIQNINDCLVVLSLQ